MYYTFGKSLLKVLFTEVKSLDQCETYLSLDYTLTAWLAQLLTIDFLCLVSWVFDPRKKQIFVWPIGPKGGLLHVWLPWWPNIFIFKIFFNWVLLLFSYFFPFFHIYIHIYIIYIVKLKIQFFFKYVSTRFLSIFSL